MGRDKIHYKALRLQHYKRHIWINLFPHKSFNLQYDYFAFPKTSLLNIASISTNDRTVEENLYMALDIRNITYSLYRYNKLRKQSKSTGPYDFAITEFYCYVEKLFLRNEAFLFVKLIWKQTSTYVYGIFMSFHIMPLGNVMKTKWRWR